MKFEKICGYLRDINTFAILGNAKLCCVNEHTPLDFRLQPGEDVTIDLHSLSFISSDPNKLFLIVTMFISVPDILNLDEDKLKEFCVFAGLNNNIVVGFFNG